ncbi:PIG-L family deacetylase [Agriterribacter sp.]|uniref:PIG-L family deacetylase n=1 Tax=Agriterribacter sp. TaxID=2821509 RepID=UPI002BC8C275|nr:PIG-L family deacetylase [Agriterribacter sp.]HRO47307.1 PIG-L family deacetylase [Agriterribacter sp.]HRQ18184.1 PIG-L family deacetylase [Agriterribacter sp.]
MMKMTVFFLFLFTFFVSQAQPPVSLSSSEILLRLKKLNVLGSVLYIAAHPDDENTRLLAYLANEKLYRTGYLSITRGDGGQNLIGDEQGAELGLIRTQELLAARRIDGAEQFFTRAYDFGFSKSTEEALEKWNKELTLGDVVWVIRKFQPDVIITRFPEDSRAGHGHHSASAVLAHEAFIAAADPQRFPEQLKKGVQPWQAKRIVWNTFNFGGNNTQSDDQFKMDVGGYNALLGKGYGEIAAESRSQHKSQGFGVAAQRGTAWEYFLPVAGEAPVKDLMDGVETGWERTAGFGVLDRLQLAERTDRIINGFSYDHPEMSVSDLVSLYKNLIAANGLSPYWQTQKLKELSELIRSCSGLFFEANADVPYVAAGDSLRINVNVINRGALRVSGMVVRPFNYQLPAPLPANQMISYTQTIFVPVNMRISQPYWLEKGLNEGHFIVDDQSLIGLPESSPAYEMTLSAEIDNQVFLFSTPVRYKYTDPVRGEVYQPLPVVPALSLNESPQFVFTRLNKQPASAIKLNVTSLSASLQKAKTQYYQYEYKGKELVKNSVLTDTALSLHKNDVISYVLKTSDILKQTKEKSLRFFADVRAPYKERYQSYTIRKIEYAHIPAITYFYLNKVKIIEDEIITAGKKVGYITGAGDRVPEALQEMGYEVTFLNQKDIVAGSLNGFNAIVIGVRAYNVNEWLNNVYDNLMDYVKKGGNLVVQYNTRNFSGPLNARIGPYPFEISRGRVTDENAAVHFLQPADPVLNWPNKISPRDFDGWVQERGIYFAEAPDKAYKNILGMKDPGEAEQQGSLIVGRYGEGRFIYTGLVFFRQLPAGIGGAYRLFANLVANPNLQKTNGTAKKE